jgi:hypothetical protein
MSLKVLSLVKEWSGSVIHMGCEKRLLELSMVNDIPGENRQIKKDRLLYQSEVNMEKKIADLTVSEFQLLINQTVHKVFEEISEDILALSNPGYLESIEEARKDFKEGKTKTFNVLTNKER